jgi:hypothetical protein
MFSRQRESQRCVKRRSRSSKRQGGVLIASFERSYSHENADVKKVGRSRCLLLRTCLFIRAYNSICQYFILRKVLPVHDTAANLEPAQRMRSCGYFTIGQVTTVTQAACVGPCIQATVLAVRRKAGLLLNESRPGSIHDEVHHVKRRQLVSQHYRR